MKNIRIIPTDKPSKLIIYSTLLNEYRLLNEPVLDWKHKINIYITSDEEIKEGDWFLDDNNQISHSYRLSHVKFANPKKIILTTDQDLIKDGVQAIDDEFLQWFVDNPSCERVEIESFVNGNIERFYEILIPKKESKQDLEKEMFELEQELDIPSHLRWHNSKPKQETLEEAYWELVDKKAELNNTIDLNAYANGVVDGVKWQAERSFSLEQIDELFFGDEGGYFDEFLDYRLGLTGSQGKNKITFKEWFEQFKKKTL